MPIPYLKTIKHNSKKSWRKRPVHSSYSGKPRDKYNPQGPVIRFSLRGLISRLILLAIFGLIFMLGVFAWYGRDLPDPNKLLDREVAQTTTIYDRAGETVLYNIHGPERRTLVELEQIPENLKWATIVIEDRDFYEHSGFNFRRMVITIITDIIYRRRAGASTITQQFVKNAILTPEKKISRKIKELILSYQIEKKFTKDEILKMYFNEIPYGSNAYGAEAASQIYFGKHVEELDLAESATLASMPQAPTYYYNHPENLVARRNYALNEMAELDHITENEAEAAKKIELKFIPKREDIIAPHFVMYVKELLTQTYGERTVEKGGLKVITTLDIKKQEQAEAAVAEYSDNNLADYRATNASLVAIAPKTGDIIALVGSRDFYDDDIDGQVNVALRPRQPGSSFKPIVYAAAFKKGYTPATLLYDVVTTFKTELGKDYTPHNYDLKEYGPIPIRKALAGSLNIPAVKTIYLAGISNVLDLADSLGYTTFADRSRFGLSLVLGGGEVKLLEHVNGFATFAREGEYLPYRAILKVEDPKGEVLEKAPEPVSEKIIAPEITRQITNILSDNNARSFMFGALNYLTLPNRPVAAKTGTTNDYRDAWTIGYTPSLAAGVWVGNNDNSEMRGAAAGGVAAAPIWKMFMKNALADSPIQGFVKPKAIQTGKPILDGQLTGEVTLKIDKISGKLATENTPKHLIEEKTFSELHSILHYVYKDDPRGGAPGNPANDPYYEPWEAAIRDWVSREKAKAENPEEQKDGETPFDFTNLNLPPVDSDDVHSPENQPTISITAPQNNITVKTAVFNAAVQITAPREKISRVEYYLADELFDTVYESPFSLNRPITKTPNGVHTLMAKVYDDVENTASAQIKIKIDLQDITPQIFWLHPKNETIYNRSDFPIDLKVEIPAPQNARTGVTFVRFYKDNRVLATDTNPDTSIPITFTWQNPPSAGTYELHAQANTYSGKKYNSQKISITVK